MDRDEPQKQAAQCRDQAGGHGGHSSVYRNVQSSLVYRDQPQTGIAGIPGEGKSWVTTRLLVEVIKKRKKFWNYIKVTAMSTENTVNSADQPKATTKPY